MVSPKKRPVTNEDVSQTAAPQKTTDYGRLARLGIVALALLLRIWGLGWALPTAGRYYSYHPDESIVVGYSLGLNPFVFSVDPHFYNYGALSLLLDGAAIHIGSALHLVGPGPMSGIPSVGALLAARLITVALGGASCLFIMGAGRLLYSRISGYIAAALYAIAPLAVQHGHWATVDVPATFWISGALYFAARAVSPEAKSRDLIWCGVWAGLAAATKYNAGLVLLAGFTAAFLTRQTGVRAVPFRRLPALCIAAAVALLVGCPTLILNPRGAIAGILVESAHVSKGHGDVFKDTLPGFLYHIAVSLYWGMTPPLLVVVLIGVVFAVWRRRPGDLMLLSFVLPYYILIGLAQVKFARYTLPLFPPLFLLTGSALACLLESRRRAAVISGVVALSATSVPALLFAVGLDQTMTRPDTRDQAADFIRQTGLHSVGFAKGPWFYAPTLEPMLSSPDPKRAQTSVFNYPEFQLIPCVLEQSVLRNGEYRIVLNPIEWDTDLITNGDPDAVAISEYEYGDALRIRQPEAVRFLDMVKSKYPTRHVFAKPVEVFGIPVTNLNSVGDLPEQALPHDMLYTNPTTVVFTK